MVLKDGYEVDKLAKIVDKSLEMCKSRQTP